MKIEKKHKLEFFKIFQKSLKILEFLYVFITEKKTPINFVFCISFNKIE